MQMQSAKPITILKTATVMGLFYATSALADHASLGFGLGTASPIITDTGITLPQGRTAISLRSLYVSNSEFSNARFAQLEDQGKDDFHSTASLLLPAISAAYGLTDNFTVGLQLSGVVRSAVRNSVDGGDIVENAGSAGGFGDIRLFSQYRFYHSKDNTEHASAILGLQVPSGDTDVKQVQGNKFEVDNQPGTGAWDPILGFAYTRNLGRFSIDSSAIYTISTIGARQYEFGDVFDYNFAVSWSVGAQTRAGLAASSNDYPVTLVLELNGERRGRDVNAGITDINTGSHILYISPGIRYAGGKNWNIATSFGAPIVNDVEGVQATSEYRVTSRISFSF
ncbi:MAG: transporter [Methylococcaceae bacterium]|jgi:hypothetical protein